MKNKIKVFVVGTAIEYVNWIPNYELVYDIKECDLVLFTGGEDVNPEMYGEPLHYTTSFNSKRDTIEKSVFITAKKFGKKCLGICRGSQFLCVMSGGKLVQNMIGTFRHDIKTYDDQIINVTSTHHQAQYPFNLPEDEYKVLGWSEDQSPYHKDGNDNEMNPEKECEIVYYPKTDCLGIQSHPEYVYPPTNETDLKMIEYMQNLVIKFINNEL